MLVSVLASGSKGNCTLVRTKNHRILIDAGMSLKYLEDRLRENEVLLQDINYIFLTHTHIDHVKALNNLVKKYKPTIVISQKMLDDLKFLEKYPCISILENDFVLDDVLIESISTSHDASDSKGYIITENSSSLVIITDTGYLNQKHFSKLKNKSLYVFESNHDIEMLMHGRYPSWLKKRVLSDVGHLSNDSAAFYLSKLIGSDTKKIILAHLSEENNTPELALKNIEEYFSKENIQFSEIIVAKQNEKTEMIEI